MQLLSVSGSTVVRGIPGDERELRLLGHFQLGGAKASALGGAGQRLLALLGLRGGTVARWRAAQILYPESDDVQAATNLRATLWRLQRCCPDVLTACSSEIRLAAGLRVDYWTAMHAIGRLVSHERVPDGQELALAMDANLREDLLPGWPEEWLVPERERFHQLRLHALEALCTGLTIQGWYGTAVDVGLAAVSADPLRESARGVLIDAYLAEGNACEALRVFDSFRALLHAELGLRPTSALWRRVAAAAGSAMAETA